MKRVTFTVAKKYSTLSGNYVLYYNGHGDATAVADFGFSVGDNVVMYGFDGYCPDIIYVNGEKVWDQGNKIEWWDKHDPAGTILPNPFRKQK